MSKEPPAESNVVRSSAIRSLFRSTNCSFVPAEDVRLSCEVWRMRVRGVPAVIEPVAGMFRFVEEMGAAAVDEEGSLVSRPLARDLVARPRSVRAETYPPTLP